MPDQDKPPVIINMQGPMHPTCGGCGKDFPLSKIEYARFVGDSGIAGYSPYCKPCYKIHVGPIEEECR
jgi:hypothetical protein